MITIGKHFQFDAAHHLPTMPEGHMCRRMHGHTYKAELILRWFDSKLPWEKGFDIDYGEIDRIWMLECDEVLNHRVLNEVPGLEVPTTEVLARWIFNHLDLLMRTATGAHLLHAVRVYESSTTWCEYKPDAYA